MNSPSTVEDIFLAALEKPVHERAAFLSAICQDDAKLRAAVERLLAAHPQAVNFLEQPGLQGAPTVDPAPSENTDNDKDDKWEKPTVLNPSPEVVGGCIGAYKLRQRLGEGGMGTVWIAEQEQPVKRRVALKVVKAGMDSDQIIRRFEAERQALALMDHSNIAKVLDAGTTEQGRPYFVMELVRGEPITKYCDSVQLPIRDRLVLFTQVCAAIQHAHQKGIIHRDIKPSNVLVMIQDGQPLAKVIDFGVAKALHQKLSDRTMYTEFGSVIGTLEYMSPEQAELSAMDVDTRADIYALGVLLFELLTGSTPLDATRVKSATIIEMLRLIKEEEPPTPSTRLVQSSASLEKLAAQRRTDPTRLAKTVRGDLDWIVMKCLEKDRTRRYETARGLARDIERYLHDEPIEACPPSVRYRVGKFTRRYRKALITASAFLSLLLFSLVFSTVWAIRAMQAEAVALRARDQTEKARRDAVSNHVKAVREATIAKLAKQRADEEAAIARAVTTFLNDDVLGQANPSNQIAADWTPNRDLKMREALDRPATTIGKRFADQPRVEVAIRRMFGRAYQHLGEYEKAKAQFDAALDRSLQQWGNRDIDTLRSQDGLAGLYAVQSEYAKGAPLLAECLHGYREVLGTDHPQTIQIMKRLGEMYRSLGKLDQAEVLIQESLALRRQALDANDAQTFSTLQSLAGVYYSQGLYTKAESLYSQAAENLATILGPDDPNTMVAVAGLAKAFQAQQKYAEAEPLFVRDLEHRQKSFGEDHHRTRLAQANLGALYRVAGQRDLAEPLLTEALAGLRKTVGANHADTYFALNNLASLYRDQKRFDEAEPLWREGLDGARQQYGMAHSLTQGIARNLTDFWTQRGEHERVEPLYRELVDVSRQRAGKDSLAYAGQLATLGDNLLSQNKHTEAETVLRESLSIREAKQPEGWSTFQTRSMLGAALLGQQKFADAEPLLLTACQSMSQPNLSFPEKTTQLPKAIQRLIQLYEAWDKKEESEKWRRQLEAIQVPTPTKN